jgi:hypothetical protein
MVLAGQLVDDGDDAFDVPYRIGEYAGGPPIPDIAAT